MKIEELKRIIHRGEDSRHQFKSDFTNISSLAAEMAAFSNSMGRNISIGVTDTGEICGLSRERIGYLNQMISNAASQHIHPPLNPVTEILDIDNKLILIVHIQEGILKPYMDNSGVIWIKSGADKRRVTSREELQRIFQASNLIRGDEISIRDAYYYKVDNDHFKEAVAFVVRNLRRIQAGQNVNSVGKLEIPKIVLEEIIANALIHRDYFYSAPVRIFVFSNRIEIISPGSLPDNLTVEMMKFGISYPRNTILSSFASKVLVYKGLGNGVRRALKEYPYIDFENNHEANQFKATIKRVLSLEQDSSGQSKKSAQKIDQKKSTRKNRPEKRGFL